MHFIVLYTLRRSARIVFQEMRIIPEVVTFVLLRGLGKYQRMILRFLHKTSRYEFAAPRVSPPGHGQLLRPRRFSERSPDQHPPVTVASSSWQHGEAARPHAAHRSVMLDIWISHPV